MLTTLGGEFLLSILLTCISFVSVYLGVCSVPCNGQYLAFAQGDNTTTDLSRSSNTSVTTVNQTTSDDVEKLYNEGYLMSNLGRYEDAINYFDKVLKIDPHHIDSLYFKGLTLSDLGRDDEAIEYFDRLLVLKPDSLRALSEQG